MITLLGSPQSTNNIYRSVCIGRFPRVYMTHEGVALKESYQWQAKSQWKDGIMEGVLMIEIKLFFKDKRKHDIDNYGKILLDSLTDICYADDSQIEQMIVTKLLDKDNPRIEIEILQL
jgi:crossover junction endodeoxyribonuclease RusA